MSGFGDDYHAESTVLSINYQTLKKLNPDHEMLRFVDFNQNGEILIRPEFWGRFGPEDRGTLGYKLFALVRCNQQLGLVLQDERKSLTSKVE